jgi:hypothetical protein
VLGDDMSEASLAAVLVTCQAVQHARLFKKFLRVECTSGSTTHCVGRKHHDAVHCV